MKNKRLVSTSTRREHPCGLLQSELQLLQWVSTSTRREHPCGFLMLLYTLLVSPVSTSTRREHPCGMTQPRAFSQPFMSQPLRVENTRVGQN